MNIQDQVVATHVWIILVWFTTAVLAEVLSTLGLAFWLHRRSVKLVFGMTGIPGYLEYQYVKWCSAQQRSSRRVIAMRILLMINVIASLFAAYPILNRGSS